jgi:hypothetical protein
MNDEIDFDEFAPWLVLLITLLGGFLRVLLLGAKGMWLDETFSVWMASHSVPELLQWTIRLDQHPPLYYLLLHYWIAFFGDTPYYARLLSALFGAAAIPVIYLIGKRLSGAVVGVAAAAFLAFSPFHIYFAQETRMYTLLTFNAAMTIYALVRLLTDTRAALPIGSQFRQSLHTWRTAQPVESENNGAFSYQVKPHTQSGWRAWLSRHRWSRIETDLAWAALIVFSVATLLSHNTAIFFPVAANLFVLGLMLFQRIKKSAPPPALQPPALRNWVKAQIGVLLLWSPWLYVFIQQASRVDEQFWIPQPTWEIVAQTLRALLSSSAPTQASQVMLWVLCAVLGLGLVYYRKKFSIFLLLATLFTIPPLGELIVSLRRPIFYDRTLIWITIPLFVVLAAGIAQLRQRFLMIVALGILVTNYLFFIGDYQRFYQKEDWSTPAGYVALFAEEGDLVLFNSNFVVIPFDYYFKPFEEFYSIQVEERGIPQDLFESGVLEPTMTEDDIPALISLLRGHDRVWLVYSHESYTDPEGIIPRTLAAEMQSTRQRDFYGGQVQLYENP